MKEINEYEKDLASIRSVMERSVKFISLSGLSGVLSGLYALAGAAYAYKVIYAPMPPWGYPVSILDYPSKIFRLELTALFVFVAAIATGFLFSWFKSNKIGTSLWSSTSKQLLLDLFTPLFSGGIFVVIVLLREYYVLVAPLCLIFYGLALIQSSRSTFREIKYLGATEIILGIAAAIAPSYGLILWAIGFGLMHVIYGAIMYFRYDR
ncbi:MAG: hypothetical protein QM734_10895 [Cyclobacteriaceae bacterium]